MKTSPFGTRQYTDMKTESTGDTTASRWVLLCVGISVRVLPVIDNSVRQAAMGAADCISHLSHGISPTIGAAELRFAVQSLVVSAYRSGARASGRPVGCAHVPAAYE